MEVVGDLPSLTGVVGDWGWSPADNPDWFFVSLCLSTPFPSLELYLQ